MSNIFLPGSNSLTLCPLALCQIVEGHLRGVMYGEAKALRVSSVRVSDGSFTFSLTTDRDAIAAEPTP